MVVNKNLEKIINKYHEQKLAHAFLFETNDYNKCLNDILEIIKIIMCPREYLEICEEECNVCNLINKNNLPSLQIIETSDATIKKEQIITLKNKFQAKSVYGDYSIYIIKEAEKLTRSAANTMLKFLEEPDGQVIGFFITNTSEKILETIRSRCMQMTISYTYGSINEELHIDKDNYERYLEIIGEYVKIVETDPEKAIFLNKELVLKNFKERVEIELFFNIISKIYWNITENCLERKKISDDFASFEYIKDNDIKRLITKLNTIESFIAKLPYNPNLELLLDKFVIEMGYLI